MINLDSKSVSPGTKCSPDLKGFGFEPLTPEQRSMVLRELNLAKLVAPKEETQLLPELLPAPFWHGKQDVEYSSFCKHVVARVGLGLLAAGTLAGIAMFPLAFSLGVTLPGCLLVGAAIGWAYRPVKDFCMEIIQFLVGNEY